MTADTNAGLVEVTVAAGGRDWTVAAAPDADALLAGVRTDADLEAFPYGLLLWPAALALAGALADDPGLVRGRRVLELGAGVGLPGLAARWRGGEVTQTDHQAAPLAVAEGNARRNEVAGISYLQADWRDFPPLPPFDLVIGSDVLYEAALHGALLRLLPRLLAPGGAMLLSDPLRPQAAVFVDRLERDGWRVAMAVKTVAWREEPREIALFTARRVSGCA